MLLLLSFVIKNFLSSLVEAPKDRGSRLCCFLNVELASSAVREISSELGLINKLAQIRVSIHRFRVLCL
jgi:hypothetical protein